MIKDIKDTEKRYDIKTASRGEGMPLDKIYQGNAYELIRQIPDKSIDLIITDPPYQLDGMHGQTGIFRWRKISYVNELKTSELSRGINNDILDEYLRVMKKCNIYLWCNKEQIYDYLDFFTKKHSFNFEILVWSKQNVPPFVNGHYLKDKEYCLYFWEQGVKLHISYDTGHTVFEENVNIKDKQLYGHPTIKPLDIIENLVINSSEGGGSA